MNSRVLVVVAALGVAGTPFAAHAQLEEVSEGYDLFETDPGDTDLLGISFTGKPLNPPTFDFVAPPASAVGTFPIGETDTIVHRLQRASGHVGETNTIQIELVAFSLISVDPLVGIHPTVPDQHVSTTLQKDRNPIGELRLDLDFNPPNETFVFPALPPAQRSMGQMDITFGSPDGGTFDSSFLVFADVRLEDGTIVCGGPLLPDCTTFDSGLLLDPAPSAWAREPLPGSIRIQGVNRFLAGPGDTSEDFWGGVVPGVPALGRGAIVTIR